MRAASTRAIEELALRDPKVVVIASDPSANFMPELAARHPERLMIEGICEQGLVGMAAGLASTGFFPYIIMLAAFATRRCYEQLLLDFGLHGFAGCMVANGGGFNYSHLGPTHIAVDDMTLTSSIPGAAVLAPADPEEAVSLVLNARHRNGLTYFRNSASTQSLARPRGAIVFGRARLLEEPGSVLFISCGASTLAAEGAVARLREGGIEAGLLHIHTVKPLDVEAVRRHSAGVKVVICAEEHRQVGGLASAVLHALNADRPVVPARFASVGVDDGFPTGNGSYEEMLEHYGLTSEALARRAEALLASIDDRKIA